MKEILISTGLICYVDDEDYEKVNCYSWNKLEGRNTNYAKTTLYMPKRSMQMHRFLMNVTDPKVQVDHIDGNGLNNQKNNLRIALNGQNRRNSKKQRTKSNSQYKGVCRAYKNKWRATITIDSKQHFLGYFENEIDAAKAYNAAAILNDPNFSAINII